MVPFPSPLARARQASTMKTAISTTSKTTNKPLTLEVLLILNRHIAVIATTYTLTQIHGGTSGKNASI